ncbi:MAG TPA: DUF935 domain-containing protein [Azospirillum sp.]|nr:DUF935 domain-containing protein [Azospirillum sp.]
MTGTDSPILGADGRPMKRVERAATEAALTGEVAAPSLFGVRRVWQEAIARDLTPARLAGLLRRAAEGDADAYLALAEEMEELDLHYGSVLGTRKRALSGIEPRVEAASDETRDQEIADAVRKLVNPLVWPDLVEDLLDGLGKGYSVVEIVWDTAVTPWVPARYEHRDPRWFVYDDASRRHLLLKDEAAPRGVELPPNKFIVHEPKLKTGIPIRGGLARLVAWTFMFKHYTVLDWVQFCETYGMPIRLGRYGAGAGDADLRVLRQAVTNLARDAAAILPDTMRVEFQQVAAGGSGWEVFQRLAEYLDKQASKAVLGQTMTADDGASMAQAKVHNEVRQDIRRADARQLSATLNRDLVRPFVDLNFGPPPNGYPLLLHPVLEPEDVKLLVESLVALVPMGLEVEASVVRDKLGIPDPPPPEKRGPEVRLLQAPAAAPPPAPADPARVDGDVATAANRACPSCATAQALNREGEADALDALADAALDGWRPVMAPLVDPVVDAIQSAGSYEEALALLPELMERMDADELMRSLARATFLARAAGDAGDLDGERASRAGDAGDLP